jgi:16S rRNA G1207 methylase RsmC
LLSRVEIRDGYNVLEPSCGDGRILDAVSDYVRKVSYNRPSVKTVGVEVDPGRAAQAKAKGHAVMCANFLNVAPDSRFDLVLMNPPFAGKHYLKHINHALRFLKPGGTLAAVLPLNAWDAGTLPAGGHWEHLPVASFSECGTNVNTGIWSFRTKS